MDGGQQRVDSRGLYGSGSCMFSQSHTILIPYTVFVVVSPSQVEFPASSTRATRCDVTLLFAFFAPVIIIGDPTRLTVVLGSMSVGAMTVQGKHHRS